MKIESPVFGEGASIPEVHTCEGENRIPPLHFSDVPSNAKSLALIMEDPDVPRSLIPSGMFDHWLVWNMPPSLSDIMEGEEPEAVIGNNTGGKKGYIGPCPPDREHRYFFKLYALDTMLDLSQSASKQDLENAVAGHTIARAEFMARYNKKENR